MTFPLLIGQAQRDYVAAHFAALRRTKHTMQADLSAQPSHYGTFLLLCGVRDELRHTRMLLHALYDNRRYAAPVLASGIVGVNLTL